MKKTELQNLIREEIKKTLAKSKQKLAENKSPGSIVEDEEGESVKLYTESGFIEIGNIWDARGATPGLVSIHAIDKSPQGYTAVKASDLRKLIEAYNNADWSESKI